MTTQQPKNPQHILRILSSARQTNSLSLQLVDTFIDTITQAKPTIVTTRNVAEGVPFIDEAWVNANFTAPEDRTDEQKSALSYSDALVDEIAAADTLVMSLPLYNFNIPASLKAWIDMIARVKRTFQYTADGPVGLMTGKRAFIVMTSGGTPLGSDIDFATPYIRHALNFIGITDITFIDASTGSQDAIERAKGQINSLVNE